MKVVWRDTAAADVAAIHRHIHEENPVAARRVAEEIYLAGERLDLFPHRGRPGLAAGTRELVAVPPYIVVYEVDEAAQIVHILRVWHGARER